MGRAVYGEHAAAPQGVCGGLCAQGGSLSPVPFGLPLAGQVFREAML